jgi:hypothetical protein
MHLPSQLRTASLIAVAALAAGCGGGSTTPNTSSTATPSPSPTSSSSAAFTFNGSSGTGNFNQGTTTGAVALSAYHNVSVSIQFTAPASGSGTLNMSDALNNGDVSPNTLPADNATSGYNAVIYLSVVNPGSTDINFGPNIPAVSVTNSAGFGGAAACELDVYGKNGNGSTLSWFNSGATGNISGNNVTVGPAQLPAGNTVNFESGQQIIAISCH